MKTAIVILAGGNGTRLWPVSRVKKPKQFQAFLSDKTLFQLAFERAKKGFDINDIFVSTSTVFTEFVKKQAPEIDEQNYILEPTKMDRAPAFGLIALKLKSEGYDTAILVASDDYIGNNSEFLRILSACASVNQKNPEKLLLVGMNPNYASTALGYIEMGDPVERIEKDIVFNVQSFKEKPDEKTAKEFISNWRYLWNSGWFIFNPSFLVKKYEELLPNTYKHLSNSFELDPYSREFLQEYSKCDAVGFDDHITEKLTKEEVLVMPASVEWSDIGSWRMIRDIHSKNSDNQNNVLVGKTLIKDSKNNIVYSTNKNKLISLLGVNNCIVVDAEDALLVADIEKSGELKTLIKELPDTIK